MSLPHVQHIPPPSKRGRCHPVYRMTEGALRPQTVAPPRRLVLKAPPSVTPDQVRGDTSPASGGGIFCAILVAAPITLRQSAQSKQADVDAGQHSNNNFLRDVSSIFKKFACPVPLIRMTMGAPVENPLFFGVWLVIYAFAPPFMGASAQRRI